MGEKKKENKDNPLAEEIKKEGVSYGLNEEENGNFYKYEEKWYLIDKDNNVKRIK